jgi:cytoskeleton protein RodZ
VASYGVGAVLRDERLRRQLPLKEIARQTKISERFLKAIESEDFGTLPGVIFTRNFVRQYAAALGLDPHPLLAALPEVDVESAPMPAAPASSGRRSRWDPRMNSALASVAWSLLAGGAAVAAYLHFNRQAHVVAHADPPQVQSSPVRSSQQTATAQAAAPEAAPAVAENGAAAPLEPAADKSSHTAAPGVRATENQAVRVVVTAREDSWLQVTADAKTAFVGTLKAGESRSFSSDGPVRVLSGNAGGIEITLNGKTIGSLGPAGQVRSVRLTAEGPQFDPKNPAPSPDPI